MAEQAQRGALRNPIHVKIAYPRSIRVPATQGSFLAQGYMTPKDLENLKAWVAVNSTVVVGTRVPAHPPYDWAFQFDRVPLRKFARLVVEAGEQDGAVGRDAQDVLLFEAPSAAAMMTLSVDIDYPSPGPVNRTFDTAGWVSDTGATMSAAVTQSGNLIAQGNPVAFDPQVYDWRFEFRIPAHESGDMTLEVTADSGGSTVSDTVDITV